MQFELNSDIIDNLSVALECIDQRRTSKAVSVIEESQALLKKRNKLIRIAKLIG